MIALYLLALAAELVGLVFAAVGFRRTWLAFRGADDAFWAPAQSRATAAWRSTYRRFRRLIGRPLPTIVVIGAGSAMGVGSALNATTEIRWGNLPSLEDPKAFMEMLHSRLGELNDRLQQTESRVRDNAEADAKRHAETSAAIDDVRQEARGQVRTLTIDGLREQVLGWSLIFVGTFLGGLGNLVSAVTHH